MNKYFLVLFSGILVLISDPNLFGQEGEFAKRFVEISEIDGDVQMKSISRAGWRIAEVGMKIGVDEEIRTGKASKAVITIDEDAESGSIDILASSWLRVDALEYINGGVDKRTLFDLALGQILVKAEGVTDGGSFQVRTPTSSSSVRGSSAVFEVKVEEE